MPFILRVLATLVIANHINRITCSKVGSSGGILAFTENAPLNTNQTYRNILSKTTNRNFTLFSEKRHKEALYGKKFNKKGKSSRVRHYRIVGRGGGMPRLGKITKVPTQAIKLPNRRCMLLGKMDNSSARKISHSGIRTHKKQKLNLHWKRIWHPGKGYFVRLKITMRALKTIKRLGIEEAARRFHLNINDPKLFAGYAHLGKKKVAPTKGKYDDGYYVDLDEPDYKI
ncbi:60S ribosomal protein L28, putative [Theileria equi strain WA]|uniref:60S ribosomal protein L28, putative n=1 Tax=Theileria equi strain WA TaxID=1537102 RepID=L0AVI7_THEEQ|nr:60S ribosomal protein L28, putative [Theileria equi strain WA]AFZ79627.1 60S ribosomal protein L28, putative [Theileria equi strain WA]|eukprot:XP_004829293.1 60S ribosomal protein L28, putative [Theileria equi strain WA]